MSGNDQQQKSSPAGRVLVAAVALSSLVAGAAVVDEALNIVVATAEAPEKAAPTAN